MKKKYTLESAANKVVEDVNIDLLDLSLGDIRKNADSKSPDVVNHHIDCLHSAINIQSKTLDVEKLININKNVINFNYSFTLTCSCQSTSIWTPQAHERRNQEKSHDINENAPFSLRSQTHKQNQHTIDHSPPNLGHDQQQQQQQHNINRRQIRLFTPDDDDDNDACSQCEQITPTSAHNYTQLLHDVPQQQQQQQQHRHNMAINGKEKEKYQQKQIKDTLQQNTTESPLTSRHPHSFWTEWLQRRDQAFMQRQQQEQQIRPKIINCHDSGITGPWQTGQQNLARTQLSHLVNEPGLQICQSCGKLANEQYQLVTMFRELQQKIQSTTAILKLNVATKCCMQQRQQDWQIVDEESQHPWWHQTSPESSSSGRNTTLKKWPFFGIFLNCHNFSAPSRIQENWKPALGKLIGSFLNRPGPKVLRSTGNYGVHSTSWRHLKNTKNTKLVTKCNTNKKAEIKNKFQQHGWQLQEKGQLSQRWTRCPPNPDRHSSGSNLAPWERCTGIILPNCHSLAARPIRQQNWQMAFGKQHSSILIQLGQQC